MVTEAMRNAQCAHGQQEWQEQSIKIEISMTDKERLNNAVVRKMAESPTAVCH
jgi:hypothetical protein